MGTVYKETYTKPLPPDAETFTRKGQRFARWQPKRGKARIAKVTTGKDGSLRITQEATTYTAKYRDGSGLVKKAATGCRTEDTARSVLGELERRSELVKANVLTADQDAVADHHGTYLAEHLSDYIDHQTARGLNSARIKSDRQRFECIASDCTFNRLCDLSATVLERWLAERQREDMSPANRNEYRQAILGFCNWCVRKHRLASNPLANVAKADANGQSKRNRRAMTTDELLRLLNVARLRPLAEYGRAAVKRLEKNRNGRRTWTKAPLTLDTIDDAADRARNVLGDKQDMIAHLEHTGRERALIYKTLVLTGLRKGELASLTVGQLELDSEPAYAVLHAADEKNRQGSDIPLRADLANDLPMGSRQAGSRQGRTYPHWRGHPGAITCQYAAVLCTKGSGADTES